MLLAAYLDKQRQRRQFEQHRQMRAQSSLEKAEAEAVRASSRASTMRHLRTPSMGVPEFDRIAESIRTHSTRDGRRTRTAQTCISTFDGGSSVQAANEFSVGEKIKNIKAFTTLNIRDAPRMYYK